MSDTASPPPAPPPPSLIPPEPPAPKMPGAFVVLSLSLLVSLLANVVLAVRPQDAVGAARRARERAVSLPTVPAPSSTQPSPAGTVPSFGSSAIERIALAVQRLRGLSFKQGITPEVLDEAALRARVEQEFRKESPRAEIDATDKVLTALGLLDAGDDLYQILLEVQTEQVAGYYDNTAKKLVVAGSAANLSAYDRVLLAHELTHALTDQHFDLGRLDRLQDERKDDEATAYLALVEGDATVMMILYRDGILTDRERDEMDREASQTESPKLDAAPAVIRRSLLFPYEQGTLFVSTLYRRGGTQEIDRAYRDPPTSTEQIIHPQRYAQRDDPQPVALPDVQAALGSGWSEIDRGGAGELDVQIIADQFLPEADARSAADGWDGGAYAALDGPGGTLVAVGTVWDTEDEAREAADLLGEWLRHRFAGRGSGFRDGAVVGWESPSGAGLVKRAGTSLALVVGPSRDAVERAGSVFRG